MRLTFALLYLVIINVILFQEPLPFSAETSRWLWLSLSGVIGLSLGDVFFFQSLIAVGARLGSLLLSLAPIFGSIIAWIIFGEILTTLQIVGIVLALAGIAWVVLSHEEPPDTPHGHTRRGVIFGVLAGLGCHPYARRSDLYLGLDGIRGQNRRDTHDPAPKAKCTLAAGTGRAGRPAAGSLRLAACRPACRSGRGQHPQEKIGWQAILGTVLAIAGVAVLFLA
jgi:drug/metabolite transporter (DMT)-like permease